MAKIKLTKSAVDAAQPQDKAIELRDAVVPGFLCKITPAGHGRIAFLLLAIVKYGDMTEQHPLSQ